MPLCTRSTTVTSRRYGWPTAAPVAAESGGERRPAPSSFGQLLIRRPVSGEPTNVLPVLSVGQKWR
jgi:hypothetical protein